MLVLGASFFALRFWPTDPGLPELPAWHGEAQEIRLVRPRDVLHFERRGQAWVALPSEYRLDAEQVTRLIDDFRRVEITDLIARDLESARAYGLSPERAVRVEVRGAGTLLREIVVGDPHPATYVHTFVEVPGIEKVFLASGRLESRARRSLEDFRDRDVVSIDPADIEMLSVTQAGGGYTLRRSSGGEGAGGTAFRLDERPEWELDPMLVDELLSTFAPLRLLEFRDVPADELPSPQAEIRVRSSDSEFVLRIHGQEDSETASADPESIRYRATASSLPDVFVFSRWAVERYLRSPEWLLPAEETAEPDG